MKKAVSETITTYSLVTYNLLPCYLPWSCNGLCHNAKRKIVVFGLVTSCRTDVHAVACIIAFVSLSLGIVRDWGKLCCRLNEKMFRRPRFNDIIS
jgi:hypothetical protein